MKKSKCFYVLLVLFIVNTAQSSNKEGVQKPEIIMLSSEDSLETFEHSEVVTIKYVSSLNFSGKKNIRNQAEAKLKQLARSKGYTHLLINEDALSKKPYELRKRNYTVIVIGYAFK